MIGSTCSIGAPTMLARSTLERSSNRTPTSNTKEILILVQPMHGMACLMIYIFTFDTFIIGPESDHWLCLSLTHSLTPQLTDSRLVNLIDVTLTCEDANSKLVEVVTVGNVDAEKRVDDSLMQIWKLKFGHRGKFLLRFLA